jgi:flagellar basal-body rod protein FlgC
MDLYDSLYISASGMKAQSDRLRVVSENIANADSTGEQPGDDPYRRKVVSFKSELNRELGVEQIKVDKREFDNAPFVRKYDPYHPMADKDGYVMMSNVKPMVEMMDMREARRSYEANMNVVEVSKGMLMQTINMLRN